MARYAVTFRIHDDSSYQTRYDSFTEQVRKGSTYWWAGTTSFYAIQNSETLKTFSDRVYFDSSFDPSKDIFMVINIETGEGRTRGTIGDRDLFRAFPEVKED